MPESDAVAAALGKRPAALLAARDYLAVFERAEEIAALTPDFAAVAALDRFAVIVTAPGRAASTSYRASSRRRAASTRTR